MKVFATVSINDNQLSNTGIMLSVFLLSVAFKYIFMLNVIMLSAIMPSVMVSLDGWNPRVWTYRHLSGQRNIKSQKLLVLSFSAACDWLLIQINA
jgi:hypothetical protein